ncbi:tripartite tricarboxylate transporter permease [Gracilibacillus boraciitolerans]|nr:tripartite tricarboxylate transporter permease [Gracilibacillus boraciitolerans]
MEYLLAGLGQLFTFENILLMSIGVVIGLFVGAMPGLTVTLGVALVLPFTFGLDSLSGIILLTGVYCAGTYAGAITAILINTPGTPSSVTTAWDGYPLTNQGQASGALRIALYSSVIGGLISGIFLMLFAPPQIAKIALQFGPPEMFTLTFLGLTVIARVSGTSPPIKGLISAAFGLLFASVGIDLVSGVSRFNFGMNFLNAGLNIIPACIGLFAIAEVFYQIERRRKIFIQDMPDHSDTPSNVSWKDLFKHKLLLLKSSIIGVGVGAIPGTGGSVASFIAYDEAKRTSKKPELFGKGSYEGIIASESSNNGITGGSLIPTFTLGIPGTSSAAIFLGALMIHGLTPGPDLFRFQGELIYTVFIGFFIINIIMLFLGFFASKWAINILKIPNSILYPVILAFCIIGGYAIIGTLTGVGVSLFFGVIGYLMLKNGYPPAPMVIALILGPKVEESLRQSLILSSGDISIFFTRPISVLFIIIVVLTTVLPLIRGKKLLNFFRKRK